ncbi:MAG TPA: acyl-[ACP]--phospholipid O-acyltransferase [Nitrosomonas sp.]|nr:acyl-[ACP]--phospholipid O-acyltransferase [Nitrosomonas sp.]
MQQNRLHLLSSKRFLPLFASQFLGAFNDNIFKNALIIYMTYVVIDQSSVDPEIMVTLAAGIFVLPFFLFSSTAGRLADKWDKAKLIRIIKFIEIPLIIGAAAAFLLHSIPLLMILLFLMGMQSTFFGPLKYGILPDQLLKNELIEGNALIEAATFLAILAGTILGGLLILANNGTNLVAIVMIMTAFAGWLASLFIPSTPARSPEIKIGFNIWKDTQALLHHIQQNKIIFRSILGISWFWLLGATYLSQLPTFSKNIIGGNEQVVTLFLVIFSVGIAIGSLLCNRLLKQEIAATYTPVGILGVTLFSIDLFFAAGQISPAENTALIGATEYLSTFTHWRILFDLLGISICGGIFIVPLYAIIQDCSETSHRSRVFAANNIINALFMVIAAIAISLMYYSNFSVTDCFLTLAILNGFVALYISTLLPHALVKSLLQALLYTCYRLEIKGLENYRDIGEKSIIVANHLSFLDAILLSVCIPDQLCFAINTHIAQKWWIRPFLFLAETVAIDPTNPMSTRLLIDRVKKGKRIVIFPEGRLTVTGSLMKIYEGPAMIADKSGATLLPISIVGAQYTPFSRLKGKLRIRWFPRITITIMPPEWLNLPNEVRGKQRRQLAGNKLYDIMTSALFHSNDLQQTLFQSLLDASHIHGRNHIIAEDIERQPITYSQLLTRSFILGSRLCKFSKPAENIGLLLPNSIGAIVTFFALQAYARIPAMLNFSVSKANLMNACQIASIRTLVTSSRFIEVAKLTSVIDNFRAMGITVLYLEDLRQEIHWWHKLLGFLAGLIPQTYYRLCCPASYPDTPAVILFTSGSEGLPKGVALSHVNLQANRFQVAARIDFGPTDIVFNVLPIFHSFGLTGGTLLPILSGIKAFLYPSPLHYRAIPELIYDSNATILFGTDTFLTGYARHANPYDFYSLRYVFAGAEKLRESTRRVWSENYGVRIFEGYGATETSPILSLNTPMHNRPGSVGRMLPGIAYRLEKISGIEEGGKLLVSGPNIMMGYYLINAAGQINPPNQGWYDTGDIVAIDQDGYIFIKGRAKRFAKIAGEMISLTAVEAYISKLWPNYQHAVVAIPDSKKGEQLVLITTNPTAGRNEILTYVNQQGFGELSIPKTILIKEDIAVLGSGKTDYVALLDWVNTQSTQTHNKDQLND